MRFGRVLALILSVLFCLFAAIPPLWAAASFELPTKEGPRPWRIPERRVATEDVHFAVIGNLGGDYSPQHFGDALLRIAELRPDLVICTGTLLGELRPVETQGSRWDQIQRVMESADVPIFICPGGAEVTGKGAQAEWEKRFGATYYHFVHNGVLFCVLNTEETAGGGISAEQLAYFKKVTGKPGHYRWTFVLMHRPLWSNPVESGWAAFEQLLADRDYTALAGSASQYTSTYRKARQLVTVPALFAEDHFRGPDFGEFGGFEWVSLSGSRAYLSALDTEGLHGHPAVDDATASLIKALDGNPISISPLRTMDKMFTSQKLIVRAENTAEIPMHVSVDFDRHPLIRSLPDKMSRDVPPKSVENLEFDCRSLRPIQPGNPQPITIRGAVAYVSPNGISITNNFMRKISIEAPIPVPQRKGPFHIDGRLMEVRTFPVACKDPVQVDGPGGEWTGPEDSSLQFSVARDDATFYLAMEVQDDSIVVDPSKGPDGQDSVQVLLSPTAPEAGKSIDCDKLLKFTVSPGELGAKSMRKYEDSWPEGVHAACVKTISGMNVEFAIPVKIFKDAQGGNWSGFQMNIALYDFDAGKPAGKRIWWRPGWTEKSIDGQSGAFVRQK